MVDTVTIRDGNFCLNLHLPDAYRALPLPRWKKIVKIARTASQDNTDALRVRNEWFTSTEKSTKEKWRAASEEYQNEYIYEGNFRIVPNSVKSGNKKRLRAVKSAKAAYDKTVKIHKIVKGEL